MAYIKGLKFRGFKSFRRAEATFPRGLVCLAGPNGSGKSNITDGIRFALGEASLKALRAKKVSELINTSCKFAEVTLLIDGESQYEIKRAINSEGKTLYRINGRRSTRTLVMEELRQHGIEVGPHNIIAQGQVQKIIEMSAKERRQIIDSVAGISEFDAKKEEALRELSKVEQKITEASIVLGERQAALSELEKEKEAALAFLDAQTSYKRAMASMAASEHNKLNKLQADIIKKQAELSAQKEEVAKQLSVLGSRLSQLEAQRSEVVAKIGASESREAAMQEIEELKVKMSAASATLAGKRGEEKRLESEVRSLQGEIERFAQAQKEMEGELKAISEKISSLEGQIAQLEKQGKAHSKAEEIQKRLDSCSEKIMSLKERKAVVEAAVESAQKMLQVRSAERSRLAESLGESEEARFEGEQSVLKKTILSLEAEIEGLFSREREINKSIPQLEKQLFSLKDKAATLRANLSPAATNLALRVVDELKKGGLSGIYGPVSSLFSCEQKYGAAVEAAAGQRLNYIVVDKMDTAIKVIDKLKEQKAGRCTFIPLDSIRAAEKPPACSAAGCLGALIEFVEFEPIFKEAMSYVFSDTLLFDSVQSAKKFGVGKARLVTLEGELIEKSGTISGGAQKGSLLSRSALEKVEAEAEEVKKERDALFSQLYSIRDEIAAKRKEKAAAEVRLRGIELEAESAKEKAEARRKALSAIAEIDGEIKRLQSSISQHKSEISSICGELEREIKEHESLKAMQAQEEEKEKRAGEDSNKRLLELHSLRSSLEAQLSAKKSELERISAERRALEGKKKELSAGLLACKKEIEQLESEISSADKLRAEKEKKLSEISGASKRLLAALDSLDKEIKEIGAQLGKVKAEEEKKAREIMELDAKRQVTEQRLADLKATMEQYSGVAIIDASKAELEELASKSRATMESLGNVNLRAPELYEEKRKDIEEIKSRVDSLDCEKKAVFSMIDEIEAKKRAIFLSTFTAINENFKRLFNYAFSGEATLVLEQPSNPFDSGLLVRIKESGQREKYLDSMSGGEKSLLALIFIFAIQMHKAAPFYILDEADAALDKENSKKLAELLRQLSSKTQFIVVTHNDTVLSSADVALGVAKTDDGSKIVGVQLTSSAVVKHKGHKEAQ
ncbi:MAG: AAA family ATPase [Candidatus Micrarchaeota archaeon]|nr:AAA family ATPase [Candidatus Micrarchaeota archaeon]